MKNKKMLVFISVLIALGLIVGTFGCAPETPSPTQQTTKPGSTQPQSAVIVWKGQTLDPTTPQPYGPFQPNGGGYLDTLNFTSWLEKATNGRLKIEWQGAGTLFPDADADLAVANGTVDIAYTYPAYFLGRIPEGDIQSGPSLAYRNIQEQYEALMDRGMLQIFKEVYAAKGLYVLPAPGNGLSLLATNFAVPNIASVKGKKIRATGSRMKYVELLGGTGVTVPLGDMYMGLKLGTYDGWISGVGNLESRKLKEVSTGVVVNPNIDPGSSTYLINPASFKALPKDIQDLIENSGVQATYAAAHMWMNQSLWVLDNSAAYGVKLYSWPQEDIDQLTKLVVEKQYPELAARSPASAKLMNIIVQMMKDYMRIK